MKKFYILVLLLANFAASQAFAHNKSKEERFKATPTVCYASGITEIGFVPPPLEFLLKSGSEKKSDIVVKYSLFPDNAKAAFEYAVGIWETIIESDVPINIEASWRTIYDESNNKYNILGQAAPADFKANFDYAPQKNRFYPVAVAEKISGADINSTSLPDIEATFNKEINWYFGTDGKTPAQLYDFVTVVLHEIGHGLGFFGFFNVANSAGYYQYQNVQGNASSYDVLLLDQKGERLVNTAVYRTPSAELYNAFISNSLYINSPVAISANSGKLPQIYAPAKWNNGSSLYHLNDETYPGNTENALMTHAIGKGEANHNPGPLASGILEDIGWNQMKLMVDKPKDVESVQPLHFTVSVESKYKLDSAGLYVYYTNNWLKKRMDSIPLTLAGNNSFTATITPAAPGNIYYYIKASDVKSRSVFSPLEAPLVADTVVIGPDTKVPQIAHTPIPYIVLPRDVLEISAIADDNLGIDTVFVEYALNGLKQNNFGLKKGQNNRFSGVFSLDPENLKDGDIIDYQIVARDASAAKNLKRLPETKAFSFKIEKIFDPVSSYVNDFNTATSDFVLFDFKVFTENGFGNGSLHSPHPYPSPEKDNANFDFTTILKYPVILNEKAKMSFDEIVLVEPGEVLTVYGDEEFWDYVIVEGSKDNGKSWLPLADGYDSGANATWKSNYNKSITGQVSSTVGIPDWYLNHEIDLLKNGNFKKGDTVLFRFRLYSDPYAHGWGWTIDNLRIQQPVSAQQLVLSPGNVSIFPNPFTDDFTVSVFSEKQIPDLLIEVYNNQGQKLTEIQKKNGLGKITAKVELSDNPPGMYLVMVRENRKTFYSKKIIKK